MYESFREPCAFNKFEDRKVTEQIYKTCIMAHKWQCFNVYKDYIFRCPEAIAISKNIKDEYLNENGLKVTGGVKFKQQLENYLFAKKPLSACKYCLGSCGQLKSIKQVTKEEQILNLNEPIKGKLDEIALNNALEDEVQDMETIREIIKF